MRLGATTTLNKLIKTLQIVAKHLENWLSEEFLGWVRLGEQSQRNCIIKLLMILEGLMFFGGFSRMSLVSTAPLQIREEQRVRGHHAQADRTVH